MQRGLTKEVDERWQTMRDLGAALAAWAQSHGVETDAAGNSLRAHWLEPEEHRPLSDRPPMSAVQPSQPRPRLMSERELPRIPLPTNLEGEAYDLTQTEDAEADAGGATRPSSSVPLPTTSTRPPERRSAALWIGPLALAVGAASAGASIYIQGDGSTPTAASARAPSALTAPLTSDAEAKPAIQPPTPPPNALPSAAPPSSVEPASSASSKASTQPPTPGTNAPNVPRPPGKPGSPQMPVPKDPNF